MHEAISLQAMRLYIPLGHMPRGAVYPMHEVVSVQAMCMVWAVHMVYSLEAWSVPLLVGSGFQAKLVGFAQAELFDPYMHCALCMCTHTHTHTHVVCM